VLVISSPLHTKRMDPDRIQFLREALQANPGDTFARYALAMELANSSEPTQAWEHFEYLLAHHPDYSPAYYQAGKLLAKLGRLEEAKRVLANGIEVTGRQGNLHARSELEAALEELTHRFIGSP